MPFFEGGNQKYEKDMLKMLETSVRAGGLKFILEIEKKFNKFAR
jgi:hypothetical protein